MLFKAGEVYRSVAGVDFVVALDRLAADDGHVQIVLVNVVNWIIIERLGGKIVPSGEINCQDLPRTLYAKVAASVAAYYATTIKE